MIDEKYTIIRLSHESVKIIEFLNRIFNPKYPSGNINVTMETNNKYAFMIYMVI